MFTNKMSDGRHNCCGTVIMLRRREMGKSQRQLADLLQLAGLDIDKMLFSALKPERDLSQILN